MKTKFGKLFSVLAIASFFSIILFSCSGDDDNGPGNNNARDMKYEITGNYSGSLNVIYTDEGGSQQLIEISSLPWSKSLTVNNDVPIVVLGAGVNSSNPGNEGETVTFKIYRNNEVVAESTHTAISNGYLNANVTYAF